jgi:hypothetical protein
MNHHRETERPIRRRSAIRLLAVGAAVAALGTRSGRPVRGAEKGKHFVERERTGAEIWQVTTEEYWHWNIYCEVPWCSADSRYFVYSRIRRNPTVGMNRTEFMVVELGTWKQHRLDVATSTPGCAISPDGILYYLKETGRGTMDLMRADLSEGTPQPVFELPKKPRLFHFGTVSRDHRYYSAGAYIDPEWKQFGAALVDLKTGELQIIDRDPYIFNPHLQFEPGGGRQLLVQHNRGGYYSSEGKLERAVGPEGVTLYLLSVPDGKRTPLKIGKPHTTPCTGHQAWIGETGEVLASVSARGEYAPEKGNLLAVRAGGLPRVVARGFKANHVGVSRCGRLFSCDDWRPPYKIYIGSCKTGRAAVVCESKTSPTRQQNTHPHAYLTPDLKWVIFNSNRSGFPHIYAASVPEEMIKQLVSEA